MVAPLWSRSTATGTVRVVASDRDDGDFHLDRVPRDVLDERRRRLVDLPWTMLDEQHGVDVVRVDRPGGGDREIGDAAVTDLGGAVLGVWVGDCAPVVLADADGSFAVVHAGWRGLAGGVLDAALDAMAATSTVEALLGPCIHPCCYEFGDDDLLLVASAVGVAPAAITGSTSWGTRSLDLPRAVEAALHRRGVRVDVRGPCTGCAPGYFSHRVRGDVGRHVVAAWKDTGGEAS